MNFKAFHLRHAQRAPWSRITHVKLRDGVIADTAQAQRVLDHIRVRADSHGVAPIAQLEPGFPARNVSPGRLRGMQVDLRHMANDRSAGDNELNKGLLELGWLE